MIKNRQFDRRNFIVGLSGLTLFSMFPFAYGKKTNYRKTTLKKYDMELRPHHILDIISDHGKDIVYQPNPFGHSLHLVAPKLLSDLDQKIKLVLGADDICIGCKHLMPDGKCSDVLPQLTPSPSKQAYNDVLDCRLFDLFELKVGTVLTARAYLEMVNEEVPGIEEICTHPKEDKKERLGGLINGLIKTGIRKKT
jgi:hypothetical protein